MTTTSVYIIECAGYVKIGLAGGAAARPKDLGNALPAVPSLYRSKAFPSRDIAHEVESRLHQLLWPAQSRIEDDVERDGYSLLAA